MALLHLKLHTLVRECKEGSLKDAVADIATSAAVISSSVHDLSHRLHPPQLRLVGLTGALETLGRQLSTDEVSVVVSHDTVPMTLSEEVIVCLYRVAQEALNNAIKHGRADEISIHLRGTQSSVHMTINDNGVGFDTQTASSGLGLISMTERVEHVGGSMHVRSQAGGGTQVEVKVPWTEEGTLAAGIPR